MLLFPFDMPNADSGINTVFETFLKHKMFDVDVVKFSNENNRNIIKLTTYYPFRENNCMKVNIFSKSAELETINRTFLHPFSFRAKVRNLHGCPISIIGIEVFEEFQFIKNELNQIVDAGGFEGKMLKVFAKKMNFTPKYVQGDLRDRQGRIFKNGSMSGGLAQLNRQEGEILVGYFAQHYEFQQHFDFSISFDEIQTCFASAYGKQLSFFERLAIPFDKNVWILSLTVTIVFGVFLFMSERCLYNTLSLCTVIEFMIRIWLGIDIYKWPKGRTIRFAITFISIMLIILKTSFYAKLFHFLIHDIHTKQIDTIEEIMEANSTIYVRPYGFELLPAVANFSDLHFQVIKIDCWNDLETRFLQMKDVKDVLIYFREYPPKYLRLSRKNLLQLSQTIYFQKNSYLKTEFNINILYILTTGLTEKYSYKSHVNHEGDEHRPTHVLFEDIKDLFTFLLFAYSFATVVFFLELIIHYESKEPWMKYIIRKYKRMKKIFFKTRKQRKMILQMLNKNNN